METPTTTHRHWWHFSDLAHHWCANEPEDPCDSPDDAMYHDFPCDHPEQHRPNDHN